jgi:maltose/moltooligosaccharide transporter
MAAGLLWVLDGNNTAMEPYRAFIADTLKPAQQPTGFQAQSFFTGFGQTSLANSFSVSFLLVQLGNCQLGFCLVFSRCSLFHRICLVSSYTTKEPPTEEELKKIKKSHWDLHHLLIYFR